MNEKEKESLKQMIAENNVEDHTEKIRNTKHSELIKQDVITMQQLKQKYKRTQDSKVFDSMCVSRCQFLFNNYTNIFNRLKKDELDMNILGKLLFVLKQIEDGHLDQHSGSYEVGKILKEMYIDSAIKQGEKYDTDTQETKVRSPVKNISWNQFKHLQ